MLPVPHGWLYYVGLLASLIVDRYFIRDRCVFVFSDSPKNWLYKGPLAQVVIEIVNDSIVDSELIFHSFGCQGIVIMSNNPAPVFRQFEYEIRHNSDRFNVRKFLIVPADVDALDSETYLTIFDENDLKYVSDFLVVLPEIMDNASSFRMITHKYVGTTTYEQQQQMVLDRWFWNNQSFLRGSDLYPDKLYEQGGRELHMATFPYEPYSAKDDGPDGFYGSELRTAVTFAYFHNMTPKLVINTDDFWGNIYANFTGSGLLGNMVEDKADVGFVVGTWPYCYDYLDLTTYVVRSAVTCLVPAPRLQSGLLSPLYAFSSTVWLYIALVFIVGFVVFVVIMGCSAWTSDNARMGSAKIIRMGVYVFAKLFLVQGIDDHEIPVQQSGKFLMTLMFIFSLFWSSTYDSGFASVMTLPRFEKPIDTVQDLADSSLRWGAPQYAWITSIKTIPEQKFITVVRNFVAHPAPELRKLSFSGKFGYGVERLPADNFAVGPYIQEDVVRNFHLMIEDLYWIYCLMMTRKSSILLPYLNRHILRMHQAGLVSKWQNMAADKFMDAKMQRALAYFNRHPHDRTSLVVSLQWEHVQGAFAALVLGYLLSAVVFFSERLAYQKKMRSMRRLSEFSISS